jgi:hypothetical protein
MQNNKEFGARALGCVQTTLETNRLWLPWNGMDARDKIIRVTFVLIPLETGARCVVVRYPDGAIEARPPGRLASQANPDRASASEQRSAAKAAGLTRNACAHGRSRACACAA